MPRLLRKTVNGVKKLVRVGGRLALEGCRSRCCGTPFYIERVDCCFFDRVDWVLLTAVCPNTGRPVFDPNNQQPVRFIGGVRPDGTRQCSVTDPTHILSRAAILAIDPNAVFVDVLTQDCADGDCSDTPCSCESCCAQGLVRTCAGDQICCDCGADFTLFMQVQMSYNLYWQWYFGVLGRSECGSDCIPTLSDKFLAQQIQVGYTIAVDYHCNVDGTFTAVCAQYTLGRVVTDNAIGGLTFPPGFPNFPSGGPCPPASGWLPSSNNPNEDRCEESGCENNNCGGRIILEANTACSMDRNAALVIAGSVGAHVPGGGPTDIPEPGFDPNNPIDWGQYRSQNCIGHLHYDGPPITPVCPNAGVPANPSNDWQWNEVVGCRTGRIRETSTWNSQVHPTLEAYQSGNFSRTIRWVITRHVPCQTDPCPPGQIPRPGTSVFINRGKAVLTDFVAGEHF